MRFIFRMAGRNIWRNKRRTLITAASVMFAALLTISLTSIETGMWEDMLRGIVDQSTGQIQIQSQKYYDEPTIDNSFEAGVDFLKEISGIQYVSGVNPRIENFSLAANEDRTRPVYIIGVDSESENEMTGLADRVIEGNYLSNEEGSGILVGNLLADRLGLTVGDSMIFFGQGFRGAFSVGMMPVIGTIELPVRELNNQIVFMNRMDAWELFQSYGRYTSIMIKVDGTRRIPHVSQLISQKSAEEDLKTYTWEQLMPELIEAKKMDEASTLIMMYILYLIVSFGIFGTLLMLMNERKYEMGVLIAIGMKKGQLMLMVWLEFLMMALLGLVVAMLLAFGIVTYLNLNPIPLGESMQEIFDQYGMIAQLTATVDPGIFVRELLVVSLIVTFLSMFPLWRIYKLDPIKAMRS